MGFFSFLFSKPFFIGDAVFGQLRREAVDKRTGKAIFATENLFFTPTGQLINCCIEALEEGPTQAQHAFFQRIEKQYGALSAKLAPLFEREFQNRNPQFRIHDFAAEFHLTDISVPMLEAIRTEPVAWDWSFRSCLS